MKMIFSCCDRQRGRKYWSRSANPGAQASCLHRSCTTLPVQARCLRSRGKTLMNEYQTTQDSLRLSGANTFLALIQTYIFLAFHSPRFFSRPEVLALAAFPRTKAFSPTAIASSVLPCPANIRALADKF